MIAQVVFLALLSTGLAFAAFNMFGVFAYDLRLSKINNMARKHPYSRALRKRPLISIIVIVDQASLRSLERCLLSIKESKYRKYELIIASDLSMSQIKQKIAKLNKKPSKKIRFVKIEDANRLQKAYKTANGEYTALIYAHYMIGRDAIHKAAMFFALKPEAKILLSHYGTEFDHTIRGLLHQILIVLRNQWQKSARLAKKNKDVGSGFFISRSKDIQKSEGIEYCSWINIVRENRAPILNLRGANRKLNLLSITLIAIFVAVSYSIYLSFSIHYSRLLALLWAGFVVYIILNLWSDEHLSSAEKTRLSFLAPMVSLLLYLVIPLSLIRLTLSQPARHEPSVQFVG